MLPFIRKKEVVAVDIGSSAIKLAQMRQTKRGWALEGLGMAPLPPEAIVDGSIIDSMTVASAIESLVKESKVRTKDAATALTGHSVIIKKVNMPAMTEAELAESIQWEAEQYIPFPISDVNIDFQILGEDASGRGQMDVILVAVKKDVINDYTNVLKEAGLNPVVVDVDSFAVENMIEIAHPMAPDEKVAAVNIGASITSISVIEGGITRFTRSIPMGGHHYTEGIQRRFNINFRDAEAAKKGAEGGPDRREMDAVMASVSANLAMEIKRSIDFFLSGAPDIVLGSIILSGGGALTDGLMAMIQEKTSINAVMADVFGNIECNQRHFDPDYLKGMAPYFGVAVGLAIRRFADR